MACHFSTNKLFAWLWFIGFAGIAGMRVEQNFDVRMVRLDPVVVAAVFLCGGPAPRHPAGFDGRFIGNAGFDQVHRDDGRDRRCRRHCRGQCFSETAVSLDRASLCRQHSVFLDARRAKPVSALAVSPLLVGMADGYTEAMMWTTAGELGAMGWLLAFSAVLIAVTGYAAWVRRRYFGIFPVIGLGAILFLNFKHVCVRYDPAHEIIGALGLLLVTLAGLAATWPVWPKNRWWIWPANLLALGGIGLFCSSTFHRGYREAHHPEERLWVDFAWTLNIKNVLAPAKLLRDPAHLQTIHGNNLAEVRRQFPMPQIEGGVDVYPWNQAVLFAHGLQYDPQPSPPELFRLHTGTGGVECRPLAERSGSGQHIVRHRSVK